MSGDERWSFFERRRDSPNVGQRGWCAYRSRCSGTGSVGGETMAYEPRSSDWHSAIVDTAIGCYIESLSSRDLQ